MILNKNLSFLVICFGLFSCKKENPIAIKPVEIANKMVLIYVAANNNLKYDALISINKMEQGANDLGGNLLVFIKTNSNTSYLLKIKHDEGDKIVSDTIKTYSYQNSSDPEFLKEVIKDSRQLSPAKSYALVMWSHATSWVPPAALKTKSFGYDNDQEMDILDFKNAIPSDFEYIMFDACSMGSLEVVYELKDKAKYILSSPSEILSNSFPYDKITPYLFGDVDDYKLICKKFIEYYSSQSGLAASATVSLIQTKELEQLAIFTKMLLSDLPRIKKDYNINLVQRMDFDKQTVVKAYDFLSFFEQNFALEHSNNIKNQLDKTIVFKGHTTNFFNTPINTFSGLSIYLPVQNDRYQNYYSKLSWYTAAGWNNLFY